MRYQIIVNVKKYLPSSHNSRHHHTPTISDLSYTLSISHQPAPLYTNLHYSTLTPFTSKSTYPYACVLATKLIHLKHARRIPYVPILIEIAVLGLFQPDFYVAVKCIEMFTRQQYSYSLARKPYHVYFNYTF